MDPPVDGESDKHELQRTISEPHFPPHITRANAARAGIRIPPIPDAGRPVTPEPTDPIPEQSTLPPSPTKEEKDDNGSDRSLTGPDLPSSMVRESIQEICDAIPNRLLQPHHHNYSQSRRFTISSMISWSASAILRRPIDLNVSILNKSSSQSPKCWTTFETMRKSSWPTDWPRIRGRITMMGTKHVKGTSQKTKKMLIWFVDEPHPSEEPCIDDAK